jgi:hypothetical protein
MTPSVILWWLIVGWCGTPYPRKWPWPPPPDPVRPTPDPWISKVAGLIGGFAGGWVTSLMFNADLATAAGLLLTTAGAWAGSVLVNDLYGLAAGARRRG